MTEHSDSRRTLSGKLREAAAGFEEMALLDIADGNPEAAAVSARMAAHMRRLAYNHSAAAEYQNKPELDPEQIAE